MSGERWRFENFEVDPGARDLLVDGRPALLGARAFDLLVALIAHRGRVVTHGELLAAGWPGRVVEENNLRVQISALRRLLGPRLISTVTGRGYQFTGRLNGSEPATLPPAYAERAPLVGRDSETAALEGLAQRHRLVTVVGAGGIGKTSLVQAWAARRDAVNAGGSALRWLELASLSDGHSLAADLAAALGLPALASTLSPPLALARALAGERDLLVLDNAEHLAEAVARVVRALLEGAPALRIVVTSQVPLRLPQEQVLRLSGLEVPAGPPSLADARRPGAMALFAERTRAVAPDFEIDEGNVALVAEICRRLDGLPLAIELAAARVPALGLPKLAASLDERLKLLAGGGSRAAPPRQRTLRAALDWSVGLLDAQAQQLLAVLPALGSSFTLGDAQSAAATAGLDAWTVVEALGALVDGSLVLPVGLAGSSHAPAYRLPETTRLYAAQMAGAAAAVTAAAEGAAEPAAATGEMTTLPPLLLRRAQSAAERADGVAAETVIALARRLRPDEVADVGRALKELEQAVALAARVVGDSGEGGEAAPEGLVDNVLAEVSAHTREGDFDRATDTVDEALAELDRRAERQRAALARDRRLLLEAGVQQDLLRRDAFAVARRHEQLAELQHGERAAWSDSFRAHELQYCDDGVTRGSTLALEVGAEMARRRLAQATSAAERIDARHSLARVLTSLGSREAGTASLQEAVDALRDSLAETARADAPERWAALQHGLAGALRSLGHREGGDERLEEAVACCHQALLERTRRAAPLEWAETQHALGVTLRVLAQRDSDFLRLEAASRALREALKERSLARTPIDWARTQDALGVTLAIWARREASAARYAESVRAYREALRAFSSQDTPLDWATTQCNLGIAQSAIGEHQPGDQGIATLRDSIACFRAALSVLTQDDNAPEWARVHHNLCGVLRFLGVRLGGPAALSCLRDAAASMRAALGVYTRDRFPLHWAAGQNDLATVLLGLGERLEGDEARVAFEGAVAALDNACRERTRERVPLDWATTQHDRAAALFALARTVGDAAVAAQALAACEAALAIIDAGAMPEHHALTTSLRHTVRHWLASCGPALRDAAGVTALVGHADAAVAGGRL